MEAGHQPFRASPHYAYRLIVSATFTKLRHHSPAAIQRVRGKIVTPCFTVGGGNNKLELIRLPAVQSSLAIKGFRRPSAVLFLLSGHAAQKKVVL